MPFVPSSPIRLYATRKSKASPTTTSFPTATTSSSLRIRKLRDSFPRMTLQARTDPSTSMLASEDGNQQPISTRSLSVEEIESDKQSPYIGLEETTLSIQEALAATDHDEHAATQESSSPALIQRQSTLFDNISESEYSVEEDITPIVGRASSVRVSKPRIVENKPKTLNIRVNPSEQSRSDSQSSLKAERVPEPTEMLPTMLEEGRQQYSGQTIRPVTRRDSDTLSSDFSHPFEATKLSVSTAANFGGRHEAPTPSFAAYNSALPTGNTLHSVHPSIIQPDTSHVASMDEIEGDLTQKPEPTMSASLPSPGQGLSRRVQIRPADLITKNHHNRLPFRESVVTTPFPPRSSDDTTSMDGDFPERENSNEGQPRRNRQTEKEKQRISLTSSSREKDRFPSPERPEVLFLDLNLHNQPGARVTLEIEIADRTTFDDEALFEQIRTVYRTQLLNWPRRVFSLIRKAMYVTATGCTRSTHSYRSLFNSADFLKHVHNPQLGRRRKTWVLWLRNQNASLTSAQTVNNTPRIRHIDNLTRLSTRIRSAPHSRHSSQSAKSSHTDKDEHKRLSTASDASSFFFTYSPMLTRLPFLPTRHGNSNAHSSSLDQNNRSSCRSFFRPGNPTPDSDCESPQRLTITVHHSFRLTAITILTLLNILFAVLCAAIWILFGVPGTRPGTEAQQQTNGKKASGYVPLDWHVAAQGRVLTGVIIGLVVLVLGSLGEGLLLWMGWLLL